MTEEPDTPAEDAPASEADDAPAEAEPARAAADADASSTASDDGPSSEEEALGPEAEEKPKPKRRRTRRKAEPEAEAVAEPEAEEAAGPEPAEVEGEEPEAEDIAVPEDEEAAEPEAEKKPARRSRSAAPAKPAPARRRRSRRDPDLPPPVVRAQARYVRSSARKARLVCDHIRGKSVEEARAILALTPRGTARDWSKLLESAVANAEHNHELVGEDLYIKAVHADEGPTIKRYRPRARGRATPIRKRTSHLTILLTPKD